jgi:hypothetical protein
MGILHEGASGVAFDVLAEKISSLFLGDDDGMVTNLSEKGVAGFTFFLNLRDNCGIGGSGRDRTEREPSSQACGKLDVRLLQIRLALP